MIHSWRLGKGRASIAPLMWLVGATTLAGCGGAESEVSGVVKLDGEALGPGVIVFAPVDGNSNPSDGAVQVNGEYFLKTAGAVGLKPGKYQVGVSVFKQPQVRPGERSMEVAKRLTPEKYAEPSSSGLEYDVTRGKNTIDIELSSK